MLRFKPMANNKVFEIIEREVARQSNSISLIASENITSKNVRIANASVFTNKYAEGYPNARYYSGCEFADEVESLCIDLVKEIFECKWANVQSHSGSQANTAVYFGLLNPGDTILSLSLESGGHLTHGAKVSSSSTFYNIVHYSVDENGIIDMNSVAELAKTHKPKLIITGASAYPRNWDWKAFQTIAKSCNAYLLADIAHIAGLIAGKAIENPMPYVDIMTSTTHKTLRGPRGGIIMSNNLDIGKLVDRAIFPGTQGGPIVNTIAAKAIGFSENLTPEFQEYSKNVMKNAQILAREILNAGGKLTTGGTDNHLMILDCKSFGMDAKETEKLLLEANILLSVSALMGESWRTPSGVRLGTPYITTLGLSDITDFAKLFVEALQTKKIETLKDYTINTAQKMYHSFL